MPTFLHSHFRFALGCLRIVLRGGRLYWGWVTVLLLLMAVGGTAYARQFVQGLETTNMDNAVSWAFYIGNFTFLVGVAAAAVVLVIPAYVYHWKPIKEIVVIGEHVPLSSKHARIECVTCHTQRRAHTERCVQCHEQARGHTEASVLGSMKERMQELLDSGEVMEDTDGALPPPLDCLDCHYRLSSRPATFAQIDPLEHVPDTQSKKDCVQCHRAHDPKPQMGHAMPIPICRDGRDCCLSCHLRIDELTSDDRVYRPATSPTGVLLPPRAVREVGYSEDTFVDWILNPPVVAPAHGHGRFECISCHGVPPKFSELADRVHNFGLEPVQCGRCHLGSNIVDQQVMRARAGEEVFPTDHHH